jgi:aspartyl-tRNA(Asn)/glutamyl-tRNA(Gln) amidotransferase subunit C
MRVKHFHPVLLCSLAVRSQTAAVAVDRSQVHHIAELARLALSPDQEEAMAKELDAVLGLFEVLRAAPVDELAPLAHPGDPVLRLRADEVTEPDRSEAFQAIAPNACGGYYLVPKVIE